MKYTLRILTCDKEYSYTLKALPHYTWDTLLGFENTFEDLVKLDSLAKVTDAMIKPNFLNEFYEQILDKEPRYVSIYKDYLLHLVFNIQFCSFDSIRAFKRPSLVYLESYQNDEGDFIKYDYVNKNFNYNYVVAEYESKYGNK